MITVSGTINQIPVKTNHLDEFIPLLKEKNISYKFVGSMIGYFIYEFNSEKDQRKAVRLRDSIYRTHRLTQGS